MDKLSPQDQRKVWARIFLVSYKSQPSDIGEQNRIDKAADEADNVMPIDFVE